MPRLPRRPHDDVADLAHRLAAIRHALIAETEVNPSDQLAYGRPHETARSRGHLRYTPTGVRLPGTVKVPPDCPQPVKGRCECKPDGSWRPVTGSRRADNLAHTAEVVALEGGHTCPEDGSHPDPCPMTDRVWTNALYVQQIDKTWICVRPMLAARERLHRQSMRRFLVLDRLFAGQSLTAAWDGLGVPVDHVASTLAICRDLEAWAAEEETAEYVRRPNFWRVSVRPTWIEKSASQQTAESVA